MVNDQEKIEKIIADRKRAHAFLIKKSKVYKVFVELENKTFSSGALDKKTKELIAVSLSLYKNCESCMEWHIKEALASGATEEQIIEALEVGMEFGGGPGTVSARFALSALAYHKSRITSD